MNSWRIKLDEHIVDVKCNERQVSNCAIKLDYVFCDGYNKDGLVGAFSHFHEDHIGSVIDCIGVYDKLITHEITFKGIIALKPGIKHRVQWLPQNFGTKFYTDTGYVELLKANHIPGSSQIYVSTGDKSLLYSGDFNFPDVQVKHADYLVLDATHGDPWYDGKTDRRSVMNRLFEDIQEKARLDKPIVVQTSSGTMQEIIHHFEIVYGQKLDDSISFVMDKKQEDVLKSIYEDEKKEFRIAIHYDSREYWSIIKNNKKCIIFMTKSILSEELRSFYKIIIDQFRFSKDQSPIIPFENGCRYNLSAHASIQDIYSYVESVNPKYVVTDNSRSKYAEKLAKLIEQRFQNIKTVYRPPYHIHDF